MSFTSMVWQVVKSLFNLFRRALLPNKKDIIVGLIISVPVYILLGAGIILLLPLIIAGVFVVYMMRRLWKMAVLYWTLRVMKNKTADELNTINKLFK